MPLRVCLPSQCIWTADQANDLEALYGSSCQTDSDCKSSIDGPTGRCERAFRAYCPERCEYFENKVGLMVAGSLTASSVQIIAADELALATDQYKINRNLARRWKPSLRTTSAYK